MDGSGLAALVMVFVLAFMLAGLRRQVVRLENVVLRLQDRVTELSAKAAPAPSPTIDIEPFVD